ncbi:MAG TPA: sigma 54-interacting transcriptional regulator [Polyangiaceae bacterium]
MRQGSRSRSDSTTNLAPEAEGMELLVTSDTSTSTTALPLEGEVSIGRADDADLRLASTSVSRKHAILRVRRAGVTLEDLGSSNGTLLRGERAPERREVPVNPGDSMLVGEFVLTLRRRRSVVAFVTPSLPVAGIEGEPPFVLSSPVMLALHRQTAGVARSEMTVLILGETGVGKDVFARSIHDRSRRAGRPFLRLNCAALAEPLLESELFGHEKGAFTGADHAKPGLLLAASGGTVFLDEIGELPARLQPKLLQVLERREILSIGSVRPRPIDVRFIAATNRDLEVAVSRGDFRADLYYRLSGFVARIPPLRERPEDIFPLAEEFLRGATAAQDLRSPPRMTEAARSKLLAHSWPGNVRELRNAIERAIVLCEGQPIAPEHLPLQKTGLASATAEVAQADARNELPISDLSAQELEERQRILDALAASAGNQSKAASKLGISRSTLLSRLDAYRIGRPRKRPR